MFASDAYVESDVEHVGGASSEYTHELAVCENPFILSPWLEYLSYISQSSNDNGKRYSKLFSIYERAVAALPGSYKLWREYAQAFRIFAEQYHPLHPSRAAARTVSKRAAIALHSSPVLWADLVQHQLSDSRLTDARETIDVALRILPVTQHDHVWNVVCEKYPWKEAPIPAVHLFRRYSMFAPLDAPLLLTRALISSSHIDDALHTLRLALSDPTWVPPDMTRHQVFLFFVQTAARYAKAVRSTPVFEVVREAVAEGGPSNGEIWATLAQFYARRADFEKARSVLEHAVTSVNVVRDFAVAFDAYSKLEESIIDVLATQLEKDRGTGREHKIQQKIALHLTRLEHLIDRRPMLLSDVHLRQNIHNVHEWHKRMRMLKATKQTTAIIDGYSRAIRAVDVQKATHGRKHTLWLAFARFYEQSNDLPSARRVLESAISDESNFRTVEDVAAVWCEYGEMELRAGDIQGASKVLRQAVSFNTSSTQPISSPSDDERPTVAVRRSRRLWLFLLDTLQSGEDVDDVIAAHTRMLDARIATPASILSGVKYLEKRRLFEYAFRLYDRAASAFAWPESLQIWLVYLSKFVERYGPKRVERARDLFEEAIRSAPTVKSGGVSSPHPLVKILYLMYAEMEERFGACRYALSVLRRAAVAVREEDKAEIYRLCIVKTAMLEGVSHTREVYTEALQSMRDLEAVVEFACRFAIMERRLGEIDRARAIYVECCGVVDTRLDGNFARFWRDWQAFEAEVGNEDTVRDMLRYRRRVQLDHQNVIVDRTALMGVGISNMVRDGEIGGETEVGDIHGSDSEGHEGLKKTTDSNDDGGDDDKLDDDGGDFDDAAAAADDDDNSADSGGDVVEVDVHDREGDDATEQNKAVALSLTEGVNSGEEDLIGAVMVEDVPPPAHPNRETADNAITPSSEPLTPPKAEPIQSLASKPVGAVQPMATVIEGGSSEVLNTRTNIDEKNTKEASVGGSKTRKRRWDVAS